MLSERRLFPLLVALFCLLSVAPIWVGHYLPMTDLPQHVAQLSIWQRWDDPSFGYQEIYRSNSLLAHRLVATVVLGLAHLLPLMVAVKVLVSAAVLGLPLVCLLWLRELDGDPWWVFSVFPAAYGFSFYLGFLHFVVGIPVALLVLLAAYRFSQRPSLRLGLALVAGLYGLFFSHVILLGLTGLVAGGMMLVGAHNRRARWAGLGCLASVLPLIVTWLVLTRLGEQSSTPVETIWEFSLERLLVSPRFVVGEFEGMGHWWVGLVLMACPWLAGGRPSRRPQRWLLFSVAAGLFALAPSTFMGTGFLYHRFAVFFVPGLLLAFERGARASALRRGAVPTVAALSLLALTPRFMSFNEEAKDFDQVLAAMEPQRKVLSLVYDSSSESFSSLPFLHFGAWYQVEKGGVVDFSFAEFFANPFRYRPEHDPPLPESFEWAPIQFDWHRHGGDRYDYYLMRIDPARPPPSPFRGATDRIEPLASAGRWLLFERTDSVLEGEGEEEGP